MNLREGNTVADGHICDGVDCKLATHTVDDCDVGLRTANVLSAVERMESALYRSPGAVIGRVLSDPINAFAAGMIAASLFIILMARR
jgi:hypothetical protein